MNMNMNMTPSMWPVRFVWFCRPRPRCKKTFCLFHFSTHPITANLGYSEFLSGFRWRCACHAFGVRFKSVSRLPKESLNTIVRRHMCPGTIHQVPQNQRAQSSPQVGTRPHEPEHHHQHEPHQHQHALFLLSPLISLSLSLSCSQNLSNQTLRTRPSDRQQLTGSSRQ